METCNHMYINNILPMGMISNSFSHQYVYNHILYKMTATMNNWWIIATVFFS
jgi:hypothetical protein